MPDAKTLVSQLLGTAPAEPTESPPQSGFSPRQLVDQLLSLEAPPERAGPAIAREGLRTQTTWEQVRPRLEAAGVDPERHRQDYQLAEAEAVQKGEGYGRGEGLTRTLTGTAEAYYRRFSPLGFLTDASGTKKYGEAVRRFNENKATPEDIQWIARYRRLEQLKAEQDKTLAGKVVGGVGGLSQLGAEMGAGAGLIGKAGALPGAAGRVGGRVAGALGFGEAAAPPLLAARNLSPVGRAAQFVGNRTVLGAVAPSGYVEQARQANVAAGREPDDLRGYPAPVAMAVANSMVIGSLQSKIGATVPTKVGRGLVRGGLGTAEAAGVSAAGGLADEFLADAYKTNTKYGVLGKALGLGGQQSDAPGAAKEALATVLTFSLFSALTHPGGPKEAKEAGKELLDKGKEAADADPAGTVATVKPLVDPPAPRSPAEPMWGKAEIQAHIDALPDGAMKDYAQAVLDSRPADFQAPASAFRRPGPRPSGRPQMPAASENGVPLAVKLPEPAPEPTKPATEPGLLERAKATAAALAARYGKPAAPAPEAGKPPAAPESRPVAPEPPAGETAVQVGEKPPVNAQEPQAGGETPSAVRRRQLMERIKAAGETKPAADTTLGDLVEAAGLGGRTSKEKPAGEFSHYLDYPAEKEGLQTILRWHPEKSAVEVAFEFKNTYGGLVDAAKQRMPAGHAVTLMRDLTKIATAAKEKGLAVEFRAEDNRAALYDRGLTRAGFRRVGEPAPVGAEWMGLKQYRYEPVPAESPGKPAEPAAAGLPPAPAAPKPAPKPQPQPADPAASLPPLVLREMMEKVKLPWSADLSPEQVVARLRATRLGKALLEAELAEQPPPPASKAAPEPAPAEPAKPVDPFTAAGLTAREQTVIVGRRQGRTLEDIGQELGVSREWVRQIEAEAQEKLGRSRSVAKEHAAEKAANSGQLQDLADAVPAGELGAEQARVGDRQRALDRAEKVMSKIISLWEKEKADAGDAGLHPDREAALHGLVTRLGEIATAGRPLSAAQARALLSEARTAGRRPAAQKAGRVKKPAPDPAASLAAWTEAAKAGNTGAMTGHRAALKRAGYTQIGKAGDTRRFDPETDREREGGGRSARVEVVRAGWRGPDGKVVQKAIVERHADQQDAKAEYEANVAGPVRDLFRREVELDHPDFDPQQVEAEARKRELEYRDGERPGPDSAAIANREDEAGVGLGRAGGGPTPFDDIFGGSPEDAAARLLADKIAENQPPAGGITAMPAGSAPPAPAPSPSLAAHVRASAARFVGLVRDFVRKLGGATAPRTRRVSEPAADAIAHFAGSRLYARELADHLTDQLFEGAARPSDRRLVGAVLVETRLRHMRQYFLEQARRESNAGVAAQTTKAPGWRQAAAEHFRRADELGRKAREVGTVIGGKTHDALLTNPLMTEADYQHALRDPMVQEVLARYRRLVVPVAEKAFRQAQGMDEADPINSPTQLPNTPFTLKAVRPGEETPGTILTAGRGNLGAPRLRRLGASRQATGGAAHGYETDLNEIVWNMLDDRVPLAAKAELYRTLHAAGLGVWMKPGERPGEGWERLPDVKPPRGTQAAEKGEVDFYVHPEVKGEVRQALGTDLPPIRLPLTAASSWAALVSTVELASHTKNVLTQLTRPGLNPLDLIRAAKGLVLGDREVKARIVELARIGALREHGADSGQLKFLGRFDPTYYTGKFLTLLDRAMRVATDQAFDRLAARGWVEPTEANRRDFVNQIGNYNKRTQNKAVAWLRDTGIGPFATASANFWVHGLRSALGRPGVRAADRLSMFKLHAETVGRLAALPVVTAVANYVLHGRADGDDNTPLGALKLFSAGGKTSYLDLTNLTGLSRGVREVGLKAMLEGTRPGAKRAGATPGTAADRAVKDIVMAATSAGVGPAVEAAIVFTTGHNAYGIPEAHTARKGESQALYNALATFWSLNPILEAWLKEPAERQIGIRPTPGEVRRHGTAGERVMKMFGPFGVGTRPSPPGKPLPRK